MHDNKVFEEVVNEIATKYWDTDLEHPYIVAGDTDSFFIKMQDLANKHNLEVSEVYTYGMKYLDIINNKLLKDFIPELLNWNKDQVHLFLEYEATGKSYHINAKKKYAFYKQHPTEELDIKGLEIRRSDYPLRTKEKLTELLSMIIIDEKPVNEIKKFIEDVADSFAKDLEKFDLSLARPVSYTKSAEEYKKIPAAVLAMLFWNELIEDEVFKPGTKGLSFKIKFIPEYAPDKVIDSWENIRRKYNQKNRDPEWLVVPENTTYQQIQELVSNSIIVDTEYMLDFVWYERVRILMEGFKDFSIGEIKDNNDSGQQLLWNL